MKRILCAVVFFTSCFSPWVFAHKLNLFANEEGAQIFVEAYFSDGIIPKDASVTVKNSSDEVVHEGKVNAEGAYTFPNTGSKQWKLVVDAGMGHIARATLDGGDIKSLEVETGTNPGQMDVDSMDAEGTELARIVKQAVAQANRPLAREISELKNKARMSDIVGGIGFIIGLLGLYAFLKARKEGKV